MKNLREKISLPIDQSFRILRWRNSVSNVEVVIGKGKSIPVEGQGDHWYYHRATELTPVIHGTGTRLVGDQIEFFEPRDLVLIGSNVPHCWYFNGDSSGLSMQWDLPFEVGIWNFVEAGSLERLLEFSNRGLLIQGKTAEKIRDRMKELIPLSVLHRLSAFL